VLEWGAIELLESLMGNFSPILLTLGNPTRIPSRWHRTRVNLTTYRYITNSMGASSKTEL